MRLKDSQEIEAYILSRARKWIGSWSFKGEDSIHRAIRKTDVWLSDVCLSMQKSLSNKKIFFSSTSFPSGIEMLLWKWLLYCILDLLHHVHLQLKIMDVSQCSMRIYNKFSL